MSNNPKVIVDESTTIVFKTVTNCLANATDGKGKVSAREEVKALLQGLWDRAFCFGQITLMDSVTNHMEEVVG